MVSRVAVEKVLMATTFRDVIKACGTCKETMLLCQDAEFWGRYFSRHGDQFYLARRSPSPIPTAFWVVYFRKKPGDRGAAFLSALQGGNHRVVELLLANPMLKDAYRVHIINSMGTSLRMIETESMQRYLIDLSVDMYGPDMRAARGMRGRYLKWLLEKPEHIKTDTLLRHLVDLDAQCFGDGQAGKKQAMERLLASGMQYIKTPELQRYVIDLDPQYFGGDEAKKRSLRTIRPEDLRSPELISHVADLCGRETVVVRQGTTDTGNNSTYNKSV